MQDAVSKSIGNVTTTSDGTLDQGLVLNQPSFGTKPSVVVQEPPPKAPWQYAEEFFERRGLGHSGH